MYWYVLVCTGMYLYVLVCSLIEFFCLGRYLGLFGDHKVPAVLFRYTQVPLQPDLINSKGKPLVTTARLNAVWKRLSDWFAMVVADTYMLTMSTEYAAHFHDIFIDGKEHAWQGTCQDDWRSHENAHAHASHRGSRPHSSRGNENVHVCTSTYWYIVHIYTSMYMYVLVQPVHTSF
jgi:hypothetical protein